MSTPIPFEDWMDAALYGESGYYAQHIRSVGRHGDFSTSATLFPELGRAVAHWAKKKARELQFGPHWHLIEIGAGDGSFAQLVLESLGWFSRYVVHYHIVEVSGPLRDLQKKRLRPFRVQWHHHLKDALDLCQGSALLYSNELVDAFPCVVAIATSSGWQELYLQPELTWEELYLPLRSPPGFTSSALTRTGWPLGQRVEIHWSYARWLQEWQQAWRKGAFLTIDYGQTIEHLYYRRPTGTLRAFWQHQRFAGSELYLRPGRQDLTADVNFTDLMTWGESFGWKTIRLMNQNQFIQEFAQVETDPWGAGEAFLVLEQQPQVMS